MRAVHLRQARSTDAGRVGAILSAFIDETPWMPRLHSRAEDIQFAGRLIDREWVRVAEASGRVVGFLARDAQEIHALYVASEEQGRGVGQALLKDAQARQSRLTLATFQANTGAQRFYLRHGFTEIARGTGTDNDEGLPDVSYLWCARDGTATPNLVVGKGAMT